MNLHTKNLYLTSKKKKPQDRKRETFFKQLEQAAAIKWK
jgi:hypothetical protein